MKERPILFSGPMVKAILSGAKTQTRRVVKPQPSTVTHFIKSGFDWKNEESNLPAMLRRCPYGQPGDRLWVRETFTIETNFNLDPCEPPFNDGRPVKWTDSEAWGQYWEQCHYKATDSAPDLVHEDDCRKCEDNGYCNSWKPSIHMPHWASRITLEITKVRVERVQEISEEDAKAEGIDLKGFRSNTEGIAGREHRIEFASLWDSINAERGFGWEKNPWVWIIEFKRV